MCFILITCWNSFFSEWLDTLWSNQTGEYYSVLKRNELPSHEKTWRNLQRILLSGRNQSENVTYCLIPTLWHSGKGKTIKTVKRSVVARDEAGGGRGEQAEPRGFSGQQSALCDNIHHGGYVSSYFRPNPRMNDSKSEPSCNLWTLGDCDVSKQVHGS